MAIKRKSKKKSRVRQAKKKLVKKSSRKIIKKPLLAKGEIKATKRKVAITKKIVKKAKAKSGGTRKAPKLKLIKGKKAPRRKAAKKRTAIRKRAAPKFRARVIHGEGGDLVKIIQPIGYRDYLRGIKRLEKSDQYRKLKKEYPNVTYAIFGHPGYHTFPSLETMENFFTISYAPYLKAMSESASARGKFFANIVIYGIKRKYKTAPPLKVTRAKRKSRRKNRRRL